MYYLIFVYILLLSFCNTHQFANSINRESSMLNHRNDRCPFQFVKGTVVHYSREKKLSPFFISSDPHRSLDDPLFNAYCIRERISEDWYSGRLQNWLTDLEIFATLVAAIIHDYEHTGTTNNFHVMSGSDTALLYNDRAVLENHHISASFRYANSICTFHRSDQLDDTKFLFIWLDIVIYILRNLPWHSFFICSLVITVFLSCYNCLSSFHMKKCIYLL